MLEWLNFYAYVKRITFEVSNNLHHKLKLLCYTEGISQGEVLRECVRNYCKTHDADLIEIVDKRKKINEWPFLTLYL